MLLKPAMIEKGSCCCYVPFANLTALFFELQVLKKLLKRYAKTSGDFLKINNGNVAPAHFNRGKIGSIHTYFERELFLTQISALQAQCPNPLSN
jgi:hypothetical protein